jgi:hypothetical protein
LEAGAAAPAVEVESSPSPAAERCLHREFAEAEHQRGAVHQDRGHLGRSGHSDQGHGQDVPHREVGSQGDLREE